ncbi:hypothetical protein BC793_13535 [Actinoplanes xinjiangensis]|uniref:Uncharacterized protein n=1 Tax=Actinoplanes xinjiangensis TaxID=512350 RepID=A0A316EGT7_9ACTN|nr:hypothetical protein BC793_13535 [Actinoplanes xinjiangensis]
MPQPIPLRLGHRCLRDSCLIHRRRSILPSRQEESAFLHLAVVIPFTVHRAIPHARIPTAR